MTDVSLREAAHDLDVHYMTAYRYVRNGRLAARKVNNEWRVLRVDLEALKHPAPPAAPTATTTGRGGVPPVRARYRERLTRRLVAGDEAGAWGVLEAAQAAGADPTELLVDLVGPALAAVGDGWASGRYTVADEHRATVVAARLVGRLGPRFARRGRRRGTVVVGTVAGDRHALGPAVVADLLRGAGFEVVDLGGDTPVEEFERVVTDLDGVVAVGLSVASDDLLGSAAGTVAAIRAARPDVPVMIGGCAVRDARHAAELGADRYAATGREAVAVVESLAAHHA